MTTEDGASNEPGPQVTFNIKSSSDSRHTVTVSEATTIADLKQKLSTSEYANIPTDRQRLIYSGRVMKDVDTVGFYKIKDGHTVHLVKGAASNQQRNPETAGQTTSSQVPPNAGVPQNLATGTGSDPLAGLTGARYAGFAQMPGAGMFGPDGGMNASQNPEEMLQMLENPMVQAQFNEAMNNPHVIQMLQNNPMIRDQPMMREMLNNPEFRRMMFDPQVIRQSMQMSRLMGGGARGQGTGGMPAPGVTDMTPQPQGQQNQQGQDQQGEPGGATAGQQSPPQPPQNMNPFGMMGGGFGGGQQGNPFAMLSALGGMNAPQPQNQAQPQPGTSNQSAQAQTGSSTEPNRSASDNNSSSTSQAQEQRQQQTQPNPFAALFGGPSQPSQGQGSGNPMMDMANRMMQNPEMMRMAMNSLGGMGGQPPGQSGPQEQAPQGQQQPPFNPFAMLGGTGGMGGIGGTGGAPQQQDSRPPEEQYSEQLRQLNEMGFYDFDRNVRALRMAGGRVEGAIEILFSGTV